MRLRFLGESVGSFDTSVDKCRASSRNADSAGILWWAPGLELRSIPPGSRRCMPDTHVELAVLNNQVFNIRTALGDCPKNAVFIEILPRRGYRFIAPVDDHGLSDFNQPCFIPSHLNLHYATHRSALPSHVRTRQWRKPFEACPNQRLRKRVRVCLCGRGRRCCDSIPDFYFPAVANSKLD